MKNYNDMTNELKKLVNENKKKVFANIPQPSYSMEINEVSENEDIAA